MLSWYCECEPVARHFLDCNFRGTPNFFDVRSEEFMNHAPAVDLLEAGFPANHGAAWTVETVILTSKGVVLRGWHYCVM